MHSNSCASASVVGAAAAALYPLPLITEKLRGIRDTADFEHGEQDGSSLDVRRAMAKISSFQDQPPSILAALKEENRDMANAELATSFHMVDGSSKHVLLNAHFREAYKDEYTSEVLPRSWVQAAIHEELEYF